ncbi:MAG TPA: ABC transporter permease [Gemmatimonadales bacterium]|nr:ABC transporter permease [Gemmatimonadales bacterium]
MVPLPAIALSSASRKPVGVLLAPLMLLAGALVLTALVLLLAGFPPGPALGALVSGSVGSVDAFVSGTLVRTTPLLLTGLAVTLAFRAGLLNIGAEGQLLAGACAATAVGVTASSSGVLALPLALLAGAATGALWAGIAGVLRSKFSVHEVISTLMLNFIALHVTGWLVRGPLQEPTGIYPQSAGITEAARLPLIASGTRLHWGVVIAALAALVSGWVLHHHWAGFRLRAAGANPFAALSAGRVNVGRLTLRVFLISGAIAGLAGAVELTGVTYALYENFSPGWGYTAIAVALLARLDPWLTVPSALLFGALQAGAGAMQRDAGVPLVVVSVVEALLILAVLAMARLRSDGEA